MHNRFLDAVVPFCRHTEPGAAAVFTGAFEPHYPTRLPVCAVDLQNGDKLAHASSHDEEAALIRERLARLEAVKAALRARLADIEAHQVYARDMPPPAGPITNRSPARDKTALFRSLFRGREDVYPKRWENARTGKSGYAPVCANEWAPRSCGKPRIKCGACPNQAFREVTDEAIDGHLRDRHTIGVYSMFPDDTCRFLAADFDKASWRRDVSAFLEACRSKEVPAALERSRSGNGGHVDDLVVNFQGFRAPDSAFMGPSRPLRSADSGLAIDRTVALPRNTDPGSTDRTWKSRPCPSANANGGQVSRSGRSPNLEQRPVRTEYRRGGKKSIPHESRLGYNCACLLYATDGPENCLIAGPISGTNVGA